MDTLSVESELSKQETPRTRRKGGLITLPFIIANEAFERVASYGLLPNMVFYLMKGYGIGVKRATNLIYLWSAAINFSPTIAAFFADSYLGRFLTIVLGCTLSLLGMILLWLTAMLPKTRPPPCNPLTPPCTPATTSQYGVLISAFILMSAGAGGIRSSSLAFGVDQINQRNNESVLESYLGWYYVSSNIAILISMTGIVYVQDRYGWKVGFGIPAILMFLSAFLFLIASPFYVKKSATESLFTGYAQVIAAAFKNRRLPLPGLPNSVSYYHSEGGPEYTIPTDKLRFLNKACIIRNPEDITADGIAANPWNLSTVKKVEELKILIRVIPIWSTAITMLMSINASFPILQASSMDRHIFTSSLKIPPGSFIMFLMISLSGWMFVYDRILLPLASRIRGKPVRIEPKTRMGIGLFFSIISMIVAGIVEHIRRAKAIKKGFLNNSEAVLDMSAMWLVPQYALNGIAEAFNAIAQTEFYYTQFPESMKSIGSSLYGLALGVASLLASVVLNLVDKYTKGEGKESWVSNNINKAHFDYFYWLLAILGFINLLYYFFCSWAYGPCLHNINNNPSNEKSLVS